MGKIGKNKSVISTSLDNELAELIEQRAKKLGKTKGAFLRDLLVRWHERGAAPVNDLDDLVQRQIAEDQADYNKAKPDAETDFLSAPEENDGNGEKTA